MLEKFAEVGEAYCRVERASQRVSRALNTDRAIAIKLSSRGAMGNCLASRFTMGDGFVLLSQMKDVSTIILRRATSTLRSIIWMQSFFCA